MVISMKSCGTIMRPNENEQDDQTGKNEKEGQKKEPCPRIRCPVRGCNRSFSKNFGLKRHMKVHTGERPWACVICARSFAEKATLKTHYKMMHSQFGNDKEVIKNLLDSSSILREQLMTQNTKPPSSAAKALAVQPDAAVSPPAAQHSPPAIQHFQLPTPLNSLKPCNTLMVGNTVPVFMLPTVSLLLPNLPWQYLPNSTETCPPAAISKKVLVPVSPSPLIPLAQKHALSSASHSPLRNPTQEHPESAYPQRKKTTQELAKHALSSASASPPRKSTQERSEPSAFPPRKKSTQELAKPALLSASASPPRKKSTQELATHLSRSSKENISPLLSPVTKPQHKRMADSPPLSLIMKTPHKRMAQSFLSLTPSRITSSEYELSSPHLTPNALTHINDPQQHEQASPIRPMTESLQQCLSPSSLPLSTTNHTFSYLSPSPARLIFDSAIPDQPAISSYSRTPSARRQLILNSPVAQLHKIPAQDRPPRSVSSNNLFGSSTVNSINSAYPSSSRYAERWHSLEPAPTDGPHHLLSLCSSISSFDFEWADREEIFKNISSSRVAL
eukprot:g81230.t1